MERPKSFGNAYSVDDDLSALQPFQQLGTYNLNFHTCSSAVMSLCMNCLDKLYFC